jgi:DNA polymerase-3 subunit epsilon
MTCLAVIDFETTGLNPFRHDRVIEIAAIVIGPDGTTLREFTSVVNPDRDIGPTSIHGLTATDVCSAPRFGELAGTLLDVLNGTAAIAGHNVRFDHSFLVAEFKRLGQVLPETPRVCTMQLAGGGSLTSCCDDYQIAFEGQAHAALHDARATARLLKALLADAPQTLSELLTLPEIEWPRLPKSTAAPVTRELLRQRHAEPPSYLQQLLSRAQDAFCPDTDDGAELAYMALLDRVLEDRRVDDCEGAALNEIASKWGIHGERIRKIHDSYIRHLVATALADGVVTDSERRDLELVAQLLGVGREWLGDVLASSVKKLADISRTTETAHLQPPTQSVTGQRVCFTGEMQCRILGAPITREMATELVTREGITVVESVTKTLDILVVADPHTASGKAKKARQYGIRILHEPVFWRSLGVEVQ